MAAEEEYVVYGTPLQREEDLGGRKRAAAVEKGEARRQPVWKQEATDSEGRRRFHGAFSGGFSAGFFNTVGSKEGWQPQAFASSRSNRSAFKGQKAYDFMDEDEKEEVEGKEISSSLDFDTFGSTAAEYARRRASQELQKRPGAIPGPIPDELVVPAANSIGVKLLVKMGWRHGRVIGPSHMAAATDAMRQARKAMLATAKGEEMGGMKPPRVYGSELPPNFVRNEDEQRIAEYDEEDKIEVPSSTPIFVLQPKNDLYGLGFDPFKNAPEFRENKRARLGFDDRKAGRVGFGDFAGKPSLFRPNAGRTGSGFGIGALEELGEEDEDVYASIDFDDKLAEEEDMLPVENQHPPRLIMPPTSRKDGVLPGFKLATAPSFKEERFPPPIVPPDFVPKHRFPHSLHSERILSEPAPPVALPPEDAEMRRIIEGLAVFVARSGQVFEDLSKEKHRNDPRFLFLFGGPGAEYYNRKLWEEKNNLAEQGKAPLQVQSGSKLEPMDASKRGKVLGEVPLQREQSPNASQFSSAESSSRQGAVLPSKSGAEVFKMFVGYQPFKNDPAKQGRFEQFLKDKYLGGLRSLDAGSSKQTELQRAQEVLEFENVCRGLQKNSSTTSTSNPPQQHIPELARVMENRFTSGGTEHLGLVSTTQETCVASPSAALPEPRLPRRQEQPWRPEPILCKRFNLLDPFHGKPQLPNTRMQRERSVLEIERISEIATMSKPSVESLLNDPPSLLSVAGTKVAMSAAGADPVTGPLEGEQLPVEPLKEKPVDLYKAIFSDDSDEDEENDDLTQSPEKLCSTMEVAEAANAALNRLVADDFLESLGKELGLKAPPMQKLGHKGGLGNSGGISYPEAIDSFGKKVMKSFERQAFDETNTQGRSEEVLDVKGTIAQKQSTSDVDKDLISQRKFEALNHSKHDSEERKQHALKATKGRHRDDYKSSSSEEEPRTERYNSQRAHRDSKRAREEKRKHRHGHGRSRREHKTKSDKDKYKVRHDEHHHR